MIPLSPATRIYLASGATDLMGRGRFAWPRTTEPGALRLVAEELTLLLTGIDLEKTRRRPWWRQAA